MQELCSVIVLVMPYFKETVEIYFDASSIAIGVVLSQYSNRLLTNVRRILLLKKKWSTYKLELIALVQSLQERHTYLIHLEIVINVDN